MLWRTLGLIVLMLVALATAKARAADCPGNPNALGTSRVLTIDPREFPRIGTVQYTRSLPLEDKEVVLTFDDGPLPPYTTRVLDVLAEHCVKANYFLVGRMARGYPDLARRILAEGHTIGTHSENHLLGFDRAPIDTVKNEIEQGIVSVSGVLGKHSAVDVVLPHSGIPAPSRGRDLSAVAPSDDLERRRRRRRLAAHQRIGGGAPRHRPPRRKGQGHPAAARHPAGDRAGAAGTAARAQGQGLSHRPRGAARQGRTSSGAAACAAEVAATESLRQRRHRPSPSPVAVAGLPCDSRGQPMPLSPLRHRPSRAASDDANRSGKTSLPAPPPTVSRAAKTSRSTRCGRSPRDRGPRATCRRPDKFVTSEPGGWPPIVSVPVPRAGGIGVSSRAGVSQTPDGRFQER